MTPKRNASVIEVNNANVFSFLLKDKYLREFESPVGFAIWIYFYVKEQFHWNYISEREKRHKKNTKDINISRYSSGSSKCSEYQRPKYKMKTKIYRKHNVIAA